MVNSSIIDPQSIAVVGASSNAVKPGGKVLINLVAGNFKGSLYAVNPKENNIHGVKCFPRVHELPHVELAILAIPAASCPETMRVLAKEKNTKAFIVLSSGFGELDSEGATLEAEMKEIADENGCTLIGPNCIGVLNTNYQGVFTLPIPKLEAQGCDLISSSGATAVFLMEAGIPLGVKFSGVYSLGNATQTGVEDILEYMDQHFDPKRDSRIKLLYLESIRDPRRFFKHATSLISKGVRIAAIKSGATAAGSRAAASHTGALASSDSFIRALFQKAGIVHCHGRDELLSIAAIFSYPELVGDRFAIITHAGGSAVLLTDTLTLGGMKVPPIEGKDAEKLLTYLNRGSSVGNPIDFLATGTAEQLGMIIDYCEHKFSNIDGMIVVFGSPGLFDVENVYNVLSVKLDVCKKPIYPVLPSVMNARKEIDGFLSKGYAYFPDEVVLGRALTAIHNTRPFKFRLPDKFDFNLERIRQIIAESSDGFLAQEKAIEILDLTGIPRVKETKITSLTELDTLDPKPVFPLAAKVLGPVHKTEVDGVVLNIGNITDLRKHLSALFRIKGCKGVILQQMLSGIELFIGIKREADFGHLLLCGLGGIYIELIQDVSIGLCPISREEAEEMIYKLRASQILRGYRERAGINIPLFTELIQRLSYLIHIAPEISELDINPLICEGESILAVDVRIQIEKTKNV